MNIDIIETICISFLIFGLIVFTCITIINEVEDRIRNDCSEQNYEGIISYWDADIDCDCFNPNKECWRILK